MSALRRWGGYIVLVIVFAVACGLLSWWQWSRRADAVAEIQRVETNYDAAPVPVGTVLPALDDWDIDDEWVPVELHGSYLADEQLLVRNRPYRGASGFEVLVPFRLDDGRVFVVDRGWVPVGSSIEAPDAVPPPPAGPVTVVARLQAGEPELPGRTAPEGQLATIHLPAVAERTGPGTYTGAYGLLASEDPAAETGRPAPALKPDADEGPHLSYALQWIAFGILAFIGLFWAIRRERRIAALPEAERAAARAPRRRSDDSDYEDAVLDGNPG
ncbi:MAG TPA: SURF1 family cytochrome oxidase biogenesis protein [Pseudolysinimonas sp.]|nr:SURF1 family cytochrome oxidase biogenesis protein [Pseudolysinimonas sp.]